MSQLCMKGKDRIKKFKKCGTILTLTFFREKLLTLTNFFFNLEPRSIFCRLVEQRPKIQRTTLCAFRSCFICRNKRLLFYGKICWKRKIIILKCTKIDFWSINNKMLNKYILDETNTTFKRKFEWVTLRMLRNFKISLS